MRIRLPQNSSVSQVTDKFTKRMPQAVMGNMDSISNFSNTISGNLSDSRQKITKLSSVHNLLTKLQTLFELPTLLRKAIQMEAYPQVNFHSFKENNKFFNGQ